jgi:hypothetical protein
VAVVRDREAGFSAFLPDGGVLVGFLLRLDGRFQGASESSHLAEHEELHGPHNDWLSWRGPLSLTQLASFSSSPSMLKWHAL